MNRQANVQNSVHVGNAHPMKRDKPDSATPTFAIRKKSQPRQAPSMDTHNTAKIYPFPANKPSAAFVVSQKRFVSLPEPQTQSIVALEHTTTRRIVSMPERYLSHGRCLGLDQSSWNTDSSYEDSRSQHVEHPSLETLGTPSPPSSPDSVLIICTDNSNPSANFSRLTKQDSSQGWVEWTSGSPPKPIPALHGPSSLPYARCPSGAEGTIAEGDDLTRAIWGLGKEDKTSSRVLPDAYNHERALSSRMSDQGVNVLDLFHPVFPAERHPMEPPLVLPPPRSMANPSQSCELPIFLEDLSPQFPSVSRNGVQVEDYFSPRTSPAGLGYPWLADRIGSQIEVLEDQIRHLELDSHTQRSNLPHDMISPALNVFPSAAQTLTSRRLTAFELAQQYRDAQNRRIAEEVHRSPSPGLSSALSDGYASNQSTPMLGTPYIPDYQSIHPSDPRTNAKHSEELKSFVSSQLPELDFSASLDDNSTHTFQSPSIIHEDLSHLDQVHGSRNAFSNLATSVVSAAPASRPRINPHSFSNVVTAPPSPGDRTFQALNFRNRQSAFPVRARLSAVPEEESRELGSVLEPVAPESPLPKSSSIRDLSWRKQVGTCSPSPIRLARRIEAKSKSKSISQSRRDGQAHGVVTKSGPLKLTRNGSTEGENVKPARPGVSGKRGWRANKEAAKP